MSVPPLISPPPPDMPVALERLPYPFFVRALALVTLIAFVVALTRVPRALGFGLSAERGKRALAQGRADVAERELRRVVAAFPEAKGPRMDLIRADIALRRPQEAVDNLTWFDGKRVSKEDESELNEIQSSMMATFGGSVSESQPREGEGVSE